MKESPTAAQNTPASTLANRTSKPELANDSWHMLQIFSIYRCLLTSAFFILMSLNAGTIGQRQPILYTYILLIYFLLSIVYLFNAFLKNQGYYSQVGLQLITDIIALTLIMHTSGGLASGLNILYLPVVAAASVFIPGKLSFFYAALATIAILAQQSYAYLLVNFKNNNTFTLAGLTGISIFATAITVNIIHKRLTQSQLLGKQYQATIERFQQIFIMILQKMPLSVMVIDTSNKIAIINFTAQKLLGFPSTDPIGYNPKEQLPKVISDKLMQWRQHKSQNNISLNQTVTLNNINIALQFIAVSNDLNTNVIVMLENLSQQEQQAQNMKLISLGRLTASIAHEIRNPLNAISHSSQLLAESNNLDAEDIHLLNIIKNNSERTNKIIESVLLLSKSKPIVQQQLHLKTWLNKFITQFTMHNHPKIQIELICDNESINVMFDPTHLQQILTNLCENGLCYSLNNTGQATVMLEVSATATGSYLDVIDSGTGVADDNLKFLFEPFFTTENTGTGLGLYVAKELTSANGAKLEYYKTKDMGACFRISFPNTHK